MTPTQRFMVELHRQRTLETKWQKIYSVFQRAFASNDYYDIRQRAAHPKVREK